MPDRHPPTPSPLSELRLAQATIALAGCVPVLAGTADILLGPALTGATWDPASDSHFRYLSGLLLGIGLAFWTCIPALPHRTNRFRLLSAIVILGGIARLLTLPLHGWPGTPMAAALIMELAVVPLLCLWQARLARIAEGRHSATGTAMPRMPPIAAVLLAASLISNMQPARANEPNPGPQESLRVGPIDPEWIRVSAELPSRPGTKEHRLSSTYPDQILRWGNLLALKLDNGRYVWLVDMQGTEGGFRSAELYELQNYWPDQGVYIVGVEFGEMSEHWLISSRTAKITKLVGPAYRHPSTNNTFVALGYPRFHQWSAEVWEGQGDHWVRQYVCEFLAEDTEFLRWDGPGHAILGIRKPQDQVQEFVLTKTNGQWHTNACRDR